MKMFRRTSLLSVWSAWGHVVLHFVQIPYRTKISGAPSFPVARALFALVTEWGTFKTNSEYPIDRGVETVKSTRYVEPHQHDMA